MQAIGENKIAIHSRKATRFFPLRAVAMGQLVLHEITDTLWIARDWN